MPTVVIVGRISGERFALCVPDDVMLMNFRSTVWILRAFSDERSWFSVVCISTHAQRIFARRSLLKVYFPANGAGFLHANAIASCSGLSACPNRQNIYPCWHFMTNLAPGHCRDTCRSCVLENVGQHGNT